KSCFGSGKLQKKGGRCEVCCPPLRKKRRRCTCTCRAALPELTTTAADLFPQGAPLHVEHHITKQRSSSGSIFQRLLSTPSLPYFEASKYHKTNRSPADITQINKDTKQAAFPIRRCPHFQTAGLCYKYARTNPSSGP
ncbi:unnamed protein product, partial [Ectocarpus fasciculatus]